MNRDPCAVLANVIETELLPLISALSPTAGPMRTGEGLSGGHAYLANPNRPQATQERREEPSEVMQILHQQPTPAEWPFP